METTNNNNQSSRNMWWGIGLIVLGALFLLDRIFPGGMVSDLIGAIVMGGLSLFFYSMYNRHQKKGLLLMTYIMAAIGVGTIFDMMIGYNEDLSGAYWTFAVAVPFWYTYLNDRSRWWALIPAGVLTAVAASLLISAIWVFVPVILIVAGGYLLIQHFNKSDVAPSSNGKSPVKEMIPVGGLPKTGPEADK